MPATPAWPPASAPRLYVDEMLADGVAVRLDGNSANYLANVMRQKPGDTIVLFDDRTGSWAAEVTDVSRRSVDLLVRAHLKPRESVPDLWLCAAPIKKQRFDWMVEKATELGIARFVPVATARAVVDKIKPDRIMSHMIEAAEQCERNALPELAELTSLNALLAKWPEDRTLFFCDERLHEGEADDAGGGGELSAAITANPGPAALLIGPEGGFTYTEMGAVRACPKAVPVSLGPRILRAETAALAAIAIWISSATGQ